MLVDKDPPFLAEPTMWLCLGLCILAIADVPPSDEAVKVFSCEFGEANDRDFNDWPDRWTRRRGPGFPQYVRAWLDFDAIDDTHGLLRVELNGADVEVLSPLIPIDDRHAYAVEATLKTAGLVEDRALVTLTFLDEQRQPLGTWRSKSLTGTLPWTTVTIAPATLRENTPRYAMLGLVIESGSPPDLKGTVWFQEVRVVQLPRIAIDTARPLSLYHNPNDCELVINASGLREPVETIEVTVYDQVEQVVSHHALKPQWQTAGGARTASDDASSPAGQLHAAMRLRPALDFGFYRAEATLRTHSGQRLRAACPITIARPLAQRGGRFGLSFAEGAVPVDDETLRELVSESAAGWVKLPLWQSADDTASTTAPERLIQQWAAGGLRTVGVLATPPEAVRQQMPHVNLNAAADVFAVPAKIWYPSVEETFVQYGLEVRDWQLGSDRDRSFVGYPDLVTHIAELTRQLELAGEAFRLGIGWDWTDAFPSPAARSISFLAMSAEPPLSDQEVAAYAAHAHDGPRRFAQLDPAWLARQPPQRRAGLLVQWMLSAAMAGADATFLLEPFNEQAGLFDQLGRPTELFLPWRTTADALREARYVGHLTLPSGSENRVFVRGEEAIVALWGAGAGYATLPAGSELRACNVYGVPIPLENDGTAWQVPIDREPCFVFGIDAAVARWQLAAHFAQPSIPSVPGRLFEQALVLANPFDKAVNGRAQIVAPPGWIVSPAEFNFEIAAGDTFEQPVGITLRYGADSGPQAVTIDCEVFAERTYRIEALRTLRVGSEEVEIQIATHFDADGSLEIELLLINRSDQPVQFLCNLFSKGRRRQQLTLAGPPRAQTPLAIRLPEGEELLGEPFWLQAAEVGTNSVLNYRFVAER